MDGGGAAGRGFMEETEVQAVAAAGRRDGSGGEAIAVGGDGEAP